MSVKEWELIISEIKLGVQRIVKKCEATELLCRFKGYYVAEYRGVKFVAREYDNCKFEYFCTLVEFVNYEKLTENELLYNYSRGTNEQVEEKIKEIKLMLLKRQVPDCHDWMQLTGELERCLIFEHKCLKYVLYDPLEGFYEYKCTLMELLLRKCMTEEEFISEYTDTDLVNRLTMELMELKKKRRDLWRDNGWSCQYFTDSDNLEDNRLIDEIAKIESGDVYLKCTECGESDGSVGFNSESEDNVICDSCWDGIREHIKDCLNF